jgi:hypothetical protein
MGDAEATPRQKTLNLHHRHWPFAAMSVDCAGHAPAGFNVYRKTSWRIIRAQI